MIKMKFENSNFV